MGRLPFQQHPFWRSQCPRRGVNLVHSFAPGDPPGICAHCGERPNIEDDETTLEALPFLVARRLRDMGFGAQTGNVPEEGVVDEDAPLAIATDLDRANDREKEPAPLMAGGRGAVAA